MALFCATIKRDTVYLLGFPFLTHVHFFSSEISLVCRLKYPYSFFSHFCFQVVFFSVVPRVVCIVSGRCNQFSSAFFYGVFESYRCIKAIFSAVKSSSFFFS